MGRMKMVDSTPPVFIWLTTNIFYARYRLKGLRVNKDYGYLSIAKRGMMRLCVLLALKGLFTGFLGGSTEPYLAQEYALNNVSIFPYLSAIMV